MTENDPQPFHVGDHVRDTDRDDDPPMIVMGLPLQRAATYDIGDGQTVADVNPEYPETDPVVEVAFPQRTDAFLDECRTYGYPASRLELVEPIHDLDEEADDD